MPAVPSLPEKKSMCPHQGHSGHTQQLPEWVAAQAWGSITGGTEVAELWELVTDRGSDSASGTGTAEISERIWVDPSLVRTPLVRTSLDPLHTCTSSHVMIRSPQAATA